MVSSLQVINGQHNGETGTIIKLDENKDEVVIFADMTSANVS